MKVPAFAVLRRIEEINVPPNQQKVLEMRPGCEPRAVSVGEARARSGVARAFACLVARWPVTSHREPRCRLFLDGIEKNKGFIVCPGSGRLA